MKFLKKLSSLPYKSAIASLLGALLVLLQSKGVIDSDWAQFLAVSLSLIFGTISISGARNRK